MGQPRPESHVREHAGGEHVACHVEKQGAIMEFLKKTRQLCRVRSKVVRSPGDLSLVKNVQAHPNHGVTNFFPFSVDRQS